MSDALDLRTAILPLPFQCPLLGGMCGENSFLHCDRAIIEILLASAARSTLRVFV